jgi:hypothetical protein
MFKKAVAIFLFIAFAAQTFSQAVIVLDYYSNRDAFAKNCENKAKPKMNCKGKCQMMKKIKEEEKKDQKNPERRAASKNEVVSSRSFFAKVEAEGTTAHSSFQCHYISSLPKDIAPDIFHPPSLV